MRPAGRSNNQVRPVTLTRNYTKHAEGSVLVEFGDTKVLCTASIEEGVPRFLKGQGQGWITAEYGMLPRSTHTRNAREAAKGKQGGRTMEIQRLIARALRAAVDLKALGEFTITLDCDVLQADGGTRTASITGACVALADALQKLVENGKLKTNPMKGSAACPPETGQGQHWHHRQSVSPDSCHGRQCRSSGLPAGSVRMPAADHRWSSCQCWHGQCPWKGLGESCGWKKQHRWG